MIRHICIVICGILPFLTGCMVHMKDSKGRMPIVQFNASTIIDGSAVNRKINLLPTQCGTMAGDFQQQLRITAGRNAALGQYPWMVRLAYKSRQSDLESPDDDFRCGGVLISDRYVLTAAHCVQSRDIQVSSIRLGEFDARTDPDCTESDGRSLCSDRVVDVAINQSDVTVHQKFSDRSQQNDIALIRLPRPINFTDSIRPVCLPLESIEQPTDVKIIVAGWGLDNTSTAADVLQQVELNWYPTSECQRLYQNQKRPVAISSALQFCLRGHQGRDTCRGDSGGPAMIRTDSGRKTYAVGIVSFGPLLCGSGNPSVLTWIPGYMPWILQNIHE